MDFMNLIGVLRRHWVIMTFGVLIGIALMLGSMYRFDSLGETGRLEKRSFTNYTVEQQVVVVDPKFWMGRTSGSIEEADIFPKTIQLATTYAALLESDAVREAAEAKAGPTSASVVAEAKENAPIILVSITGNDREQLVRFGIALEESLEEYLASEQEQSGIAKSERMSVRPLSNPQATVVQSRQWETALLAFAAPVFVAFGIALVKDRGAGTDWAQKAL